MAKKNDEAPKPSGTLPAPTGNDAVAARTAPDAPKDGKFRHTFTLSGRDYEEQSKNEDMHRANEVATLQEALNRGLHAQGDASLENTERTQDGSVNLTYAVDAVPAGEDVDPSDTETPRKAIKKMGGSTQKGG